MNHTLTRAWVIGGKEYPSRLDYARWQIVREAFTEAVKLDGQIAECGVMNADTTVYFLHYLEVMDIRKTVYMFDTFKGFPEEAIGSEDEGSKGLPNAGDWAGMGKALIRRRLDNARWDYELRAGPFRETLPQLSRRLCFIFADADLYESTHYIINMADRLLEEGGYIAFDDYVNVRFPGVGKAVDEWLDKKYERVAQAVGDRAQLLVVRKMG